MPAGSPPPEPWTRDAADVAAALDVDPDRGLDEDEAGARLVAHGPNVLEAEPPVPGWRRFLAQFTDPLVVLLLAAVAITLVAWVIDGADGVPWDAVVIAAIVLANAVLGRLQEARAERAVAALHRMAAPTAVVVRHGLERRVPAAEVVPGDVLVLGEGDAVAADARLLDAAALTVAEAALTGESQPVAKQVAPLPGPVALADRADMVFAGTVVQRGRGRAVVTATGMATEVGRVAGLLARTAEEPTPLQREIATVGRALGLAVVVIAAVVVTAIVLTTDLDTAADVVDVLLLGVSLAVAAVPEGLPAVLSLVLALGVQRMARRNAIVKRLSSVETLGSASVICSDKTGTLTRNEMTIVTVVTASGSTDLTDPTVPIDDDARAVLTAGSLTGNATVTTVDGVHRVLGDPVDAAFLVAEAGVDGLADARRARFRRVAERPFTSERKLMSTVQADLAHDGRLVLVTKGAPDVLVTRCTHERVGGADRPLDDHRRAEVLAAVDRLADQGLRTLGVAERALPDGVPVGPDDEVERGLVLLGVVGIDDPLRPEAAAAVGEAQAAGIRVLMITGDHPRTAARIADRLGLGAGAAPAVLTGPDIDALDEPGFRAAVRRTPVYARVAPEHKLRIVDALQADGHIVAMTGDGVNDAPALKSADIGVAMGRAGTDVAREAADMILADDDFATIVAAVREGRVIFANIRTFLRFLLSSNIGEVLTVFLGVLFAGVLGLTTSGDGLAVPLVATQILWINLLTDAAPALALGVDPPRGDVMRRPPRRPADRIIDREMWVGIGFVGLVMAAVTLLALDLGLPGGLAGGSGDLTEARTMAFTTLVLAQLFNCFNARSDRASGLPALFANRLLWAAVAVSAALQVAVVEVSALNDAFSTTPLGWGGWATCVALASVVLWADEARKLVIRAVRA